MSQINIRNLSNENDDGSPEIVGVSTFSATSFFVPPKGTTAERPSDCEPGSIRFNTDTANLEYYRGNVLGWSQFELVTPNLGGGTGSNTGLGTRGVFGMRAEPSITDSIDFITISTMGNAQDFGNSTDSRYTYSTCASRTRGFMAGGFSALVDTIDFVTFASTGNATDFGNLTQSRWLMGQGAASSTRGLFVGGLDPGPSTTFNIIDFITMAQTGNAVDFGDISSTRRMGSGCQSSTRAIFAGGYTPSNTNVIDFVTTSTTGDAADFGDLNYEQKNGSAASNSTRGLFFGGNDGGNPYNNNISFITIATKGVNAADFGDLTVSVGGAGASSSSTRAVRGGGLAPGNSNVIDKVEIPTTGNAVDFGNLNASGHNLQGFSNGHGGL